MPVDRFHSGFDTVAYLHLHRYLAKVLHDSGDLPFREPIAGHTPSPSRTPVEDEQRP